MKRPPQSKRSKKGFTLHEPFRFEGKQTTLAELDDEGFLFTQVTAHLEGKFPSIVHTYEVYRAEDTGKGMRPKQWWVITEETYDTLTSMYSYEVEDDGIVVTKNEEVPVV